MNSITRKMLFLGCILLYIVFSPITVKAYEKKISNVRFQYAFIDKQTCWIRKIELEDKSNINTLHIPSTIEGKKFVKLGAGSDFSADYNAPNVFGIYICEDDNKKKPSKIINKVAKIKKLVLPSTLKEITPHCFAYLQDGKDINIPKNLTKNVLHLRETKWKSFRISKKHKKYKTKNNFILSKNGKTVYGFVGQKDKITIPNGVTTITKQSFVSNRVKSITIPSTVCKIGANAFSYIKSARFYISNKNRNYGLKNNCIYSKKSGRLVVGVTKSGVLHIPNNVTCLKEGTSFVGGKVKKIVFPKSLKRIESYWSHTMEYSDDTKLIFSGKKPPILESDAHLPFGTIYVPKDVISKYKKAFPEYQKIRASSVSYY